MKAYFLALILLSAGCVGTIDDEGGAASGGRKSFVFVSDDAGFDGQAAAGISVAKGDRVNMTFSFNTSNIYYGDSRGAGIDIKSKEFNLTYRTGDPPEKSAEFTAADNFTIISYWPSSGIIKGKINVIVE